MSEHIVQLLIQERDRLNRAIEALGGSKAKRRGRPKKQWHEAANVPDWVKPAAAKAPAKKKRKMSAAARKAIGDAARKRWAAIRKAKA
jgi:hypothetical protein